MTTLMPSRAGAVVAIGEWARVHGWALAGAVVVAAEGADAVRAAWRGLPPGTALVILTPAAADALPEHTGTGLPLTAVLP